MGLRIVAGILIVVGATMAGGLASVASNHQVGATVGAFIFTSVAPVGAGLWLWRLARRRDRARVLGADHADGLRLLELAGTRGGSLTVPEVLALTGIELPRAEKLLDGMCRQGLAEHLVAEDGTLVYRFKPLLTAQEKARARGILERG
jgi:hypothetical protein